MRVLTILSIFILSISSINCGRAPKKLSFDEMPGYHEKALIFHDLQDTLFLSSNTWGITGNHQIIYLTTYHKKEQRYDEQTDYRYRNEYVIYFEQFKDTLILYSGHESSVPSKFDSKVKVIQKRLRASELSKLHENYKEMGFSRYDET